MQTMGVVQNVLDYKAKGIKRARVKYIICYTRASKKTSVILLLYAKKQDLKINLHKFKFFYSYGYVERNVYE